MFDASVPDDMFPPTGNNSVGLPRPYVEALPRREPTASPANRDFADAIGPRQAASAGPARRREAFQAFRLSTWVPHRGLLAMSSICLTGKMEAATLTNLDIERISVNTVCRSAMTCFGNSALKTRSL
jgi:hypothetical protein